MPTTYLKPEHHALRYVPWGRLRKDEDQNVIGVLGQAFKLREDEAYLSATWVEYFTGTHDACVESAVHALRASMNVSPKSGFAKGNIASIDATLKQSNRKVRFIHEAEEDNPAHAAFRQWPTEDDALLELLAEDAWSEVILNKNIPTKQA